MATHAKFICFWEAAEYLQMWAAQHSLWSIHHHAKYLVMESEEFVALEMAVLI